MLTPDRHVAELAQRQRALITREQAARAGFTDDEMPGRLDRGLWIRAFESVYRIGGSPDSVDQRRLAAVLAVGPDAAVSHRAAADVWGLWWSNPPVIEITTTRGQ
jgi:hypothetical protein